ncbi:Crp/Fnr family transcriptional regulator [Sphingomonas xanthus]|uniref:Crp/Fnr family transcriptional regulator n=1 Tax=Sphingomonas xanthus TaxID=2594473 RepID=A0A516ISQ7_9SPHN|nr:Crp/Fnr family transcriptional regulator [Sphingomonas xanthus]QDP19933.1 Crp/Fnr family transcriptional regulator [Sphingomonas xanthus]
MTQSPEHPLAPLIQKLEYSGPLSSDDRNAILALPYTLKSFEPHSYIVRHGDRPAYSCLLRSGFAFRHKVVADGGRQICSIHMKGDIVDLQNCLLGYADHNVQVLTHAEVALIPCKAVREITVERPAVGLAMWSDTLVDGSIFREWVTNVGRRQARRRLAHLLCEFSLRLEAAGLGARDHYVLPMTQEQLADCTGLTPVHVNRTLRQMDLDGLLERTNRAVTVNDWKRLAEVGDFRTDYLHLREDQLQIAQ